jgi:hypothetical protein
VSFQHPPRHPRHHPVRRRPWPSKGYALNKMCFSFNDKAKPRRLPEGRHRRPTCASTRSRPSRRQRCAPRQVLQTDGRRRQRLLPGQVRRHLRPGHAGHRRPADRCDQGTSSRPSSSRPAINLRDSRSGKAASSENTGAFTWHNSSAASAPPTFPPLAAPSTRACSRTRTGSRSLTASRPSPVAGREEARCVVMFYNDHGLNFFLDKMPTFAVGAAPEYLNADEGWGIPSLEPLKGEPGPVLAHHQHADRQGV